MTITATQGRLQVGIIQRQSQRCSGTHLLFKMARHSPQKAAQTPHVCPGQFRQPLPGCLRLSSLISPTQAQSPVWTSPLVGIILSHAYPIPTFCRRSSLVMKSQTPSPHPPAEKDLHTETSWFWLLPLLQSRAGFQQAGGRNCSHQVRKPCNTVSPQNSAVRTSLEQAFPEKLVRGTDLFSLPWKPRREEMEQDFPDGEHSGMKDPLVGKPSSMRMLTLHFHLRKEVGN